METEGDWLRISVLQHYAYCPAQASLIFEGTWADNHLTAQGDAVHAHVDQAGLDRRRGLRIHHSVPLHSQRLRIHGLADAVEERADGELLPIEHKRGRGAGDLWPTMVQVVAQALCLAEQTSRPVKLGAIFIAREQRREYVEIAEMQPAVERLIGEARARLTNESIPGVYEARRCKSCSLQNSCQPRGVQWR
ncbi:CRISPR-associated exonuclease Cas4 [Propionibacteriaceae bacterium ES.041]|uniref:CRISPR-associated protein Cas4 n=1 Tax=Enemella evansiae TaxID=2016499 RepID=UPI000B95F2D4|nr:CRISPR-associated protein Cas4 [Enemella evansiae]PFG66075.1 CRISPR-associated exonuclease Cas4 [Propionibacteriaceae bacterium ES.041]